MERLEGYGAVLVRIGVSLVFLWFGISQILDPARFTGWIPAFATLIPLSPETMVLMNGFYEVFFGTLLLIGLFTRIAALFLGLKIGFIALTLGINEVGVRDFGLSMATLSIVFTGPDRLSLDRKLEWPQSMQNRLLRR